MYIYILLQTLEETRAQAKHVREHERLKSLYECLHGVAISLELVCTEFVAPDEHFTQPAVVEFEMVTNNECGYECLSHVSVHGYESVCQCVYM